MRRSASARRQSDRVAALRGSGFQVIVYGQPDGPAETPDAPARVTVTRDAEQGFDLHSRRVALLHDGDGNPRDFVEFVGRFLAQNMRRIHEVRVIPAAAWEPASGRVGEAESGRRRGGSRRVTGPVTKDGGELS